MAGRTSKCGLSREKIEMRYRTPGFKEAGSSDIFALVEPVR
jgi:hypothetical protein